MAVTTNQETIISHQTYQNNALKGCTNIVVLACIVVCAFWIGKNIFVKML